MSCVGVDQVELHHVPGRGRAPFGAQAAVDAKVFVLHHSPLGLREVRRHIKCLVKVVGRGGEVLPKIIFLSVVRHSEAEHRTYVDTRVTLDAQVRSEVG
ncbi:uncharacterized protein METZ01_LOCUS149648, partial [marine metagenome]